MIDPFLNDCWTIIRQKGSTLQRTPWQPLAGLEPALAQFNLPPLPEVKTPLAGLFTIPSMEPNFKDLTDDILASLRLRIYAQMELEPVKKWAEKLMRYCEVRFTTLKHRSMKKCGDLPAARLHMLHLASFLLDYSVVSKDFRFLNTVIKLADCNWILDRKAVTRDLKKKNIKSTALFQFRLILLTEYLLSHFEDGTK